MNDPYAPLQHAHLDALEQRYAERLSSLGYDGVWLFSGRPALHFGDDQHASFCSFGHFQHWTGQPGMAHCWLRIMPGKRPALFLHAPDDFWHLPARLPDEAWTERMEIVIGRFETPPPRAPGRFALLGDVDPAVAEALGAEPNPPSLWAALDETRVRKSDYEITCLREANRQAVAGHLAARAAFLAGGAELDVQLAYLGASRQRESEVPYGNIVGINEHASVLHYQHYEVRPAARTHSLLVDAGARHRGYCADVTRTWPGVHADPLFADLIHGMNGLKQRLIAELRPGCSFVALHLRMHEALAELLRESGLIACQPETAVSQGVTRAFCPHGLGHLLGIQVHDVGGRRGADGTSLPPPQAHPALRLTRELEPGMVLTIEPGLYFIPMLLEPLKAGPQGRLIDWALVERLAPHGGIRSEDNLLVTAGASVNLTPHEREAEARAE